MKKLILVVYIILSTACVPTKQRVITHKYTSSVSETACSKDEGTFRAAYMAAQLKRDISTAIKKYYQIIDSKCLDQDMIDYARDFIENRKQEIEQEIKKLEFVGNKYPTIEEIELKILAVQKQLEPFEEHDDIWVDTCKGRLEKISLSSIPENLPAGINLEIQEDKKEFPEEVDIEEELEPEQEIETRSLPFYPITIDIWQSAWGQDFIPGKLEPLIDYLKRNNIKKINLNFGVPMFPEPEFQQEILEQINPIVEKFRSGGIEKINFLYAELRFPIELYRDFLKNYPGLRIDTIIDDSEYTDWLKNEFEVSRSQFINSNINYSAFITLESEGNSGVSDDMRYWVLENIDYPILMSYFGCSLEKQKEMLKDYLEYGDKEGKKKSVGIAILLGTKSVGREASCERKLNEFELQTFIRDLHDWASQYECYGGIVLETNQRFPGVDIYLEKKNDQNIKNNL